MLDVDKLPRLQSNGFSNKRNHKLSVRLSGVRGIYAAFLVVFLLYLILCLYCERRLKAQVYAVFKEIGANGFGVSYRQKSSLADFTGGLFLDDVVLTAPAQMGGWRLEAGRITVGANPFSRTVRIGLSGTYALQTAAVGDARFTIEKGKLSISKNQTVELRLKNIRAASPQAWAGFSVGDVSADFSATNGDFSLTVEKMLLPSKELPPTVDYWTVSGKATGFAAADRQAPLLTDWINNSGLLEIASCEIIWKPFMARLSGTASFDSEYRLTAAGTGKFYGFFDLLDRLEKAKAVSPSQVSMAKIVLGERVKTTAGETIPSFSASFGYQKSTLYIGKVAFP